MYVDYCIYIEREQCVSGYMYILYIERDHIYREWCVRGLLYIYRERAVCKWIYVYIIYRGDHIYREQCVSGYMYIYRESSV